MDSGNQVANIATNRGKRDEYRKKVLRVITDELIRIGSPKHRFLEVLQRAKKLEAYAYVSAKSQDEYVNLIREALGKIRARPLKTVEVKKKITNPSASEIDANGDWQEQVYERLQYLKQRFYHAVTLLHRNCCKELQDDPSRELPGHITHKSQLENILLLFELSKSQITADIKDQARKADEYLRSTINFLNRQQSPDEQPNQLFGPSNSVFSQPINMVSQDHRVAMPIGSSQDSIINQSSIVKGQSNAVKQTDVAPQEFCVNNNAPRILATEAFGTRTNTERILPFIKESNAVKQQTNIALQEFGVNNNGPGISATEAFRSRTNTESERISPLIKESNDVKQQTNIALQEFGVNNNAPRISATEAFGIRTNTERILPLIKESSALKQQTNIALQEFGVNNNAPRISETEAFGTRTNTERILPLIKESNDQNQGSHNSEVQSHAMQKLIRALTSVSPEALSAAVGEIEEVVHLNDEIPEVVDEQGLPFFITPGGWKMPRRFVATTFDTPSMRDGFNQFTYTAESDLNSFTTKGKRSLTVENQNLLAEIKDINNRLFDCEVVIAEKQNAKIEAGIATDQSEGLVVKILYNAVTINQNLVSHFTADKKSLIEPLRLLIPSSYPSCSLVILDELPLKVSDDLTALSERAKEKLRFNLGRMNESLLIKDIARVWERCAREAILDYAHANGGGTFTSMQGGWEVC